MPIATPSAADEEARAALLTELESALADLDELPQMDEARFLRTHTVFEARSDQRARIIDELCARIAPRKHSDRPMRVLGVGCGGGDVDLSLVRALAPRTDELVYVGVDPNRAECEAMERLFENAAVPNLSLDVEVVAFDDFASDERFDVVHFVHSLYYMPDAAAALARAQKLLAPGGELVVVQAPREELNELAVLFYDKSYDRPTLFADDFASIFERSQSRVERTRLDARVDVTAFIEGDVEIGEALRDFIVQVDGRRLPAAVQDTIDRYLRLVAHSDGQRSFINHPVDVFVLPA